MPTPCDITPDEMSAAYRASGLHRERYGLARALETPCIYIALRAFATALRGKACPEQRRREQQQHGKPAPIQRAIF